ncbi:hypothetical protein AVDCRST_MAG81-1446 [uncultured Synechococcales cyanobacterium]|uniref:Uncharacterized protein n=1 Tax=uncultured Synechococcales cyanobacterium TaxID=1936017 RepID=A0A6J4V4V6_9CYAN|nr:hypothetical protein AVDCRST_MAG81-1446 [uncultured Synechococcales cyanobacterium]
MPKQYPLKIDTSFTDTKPAGLAAKYLNSGEIHPRAGIEIAISCLFAPLGAAINGASRQEVEGIVAASRTQFEVFCALALSRCQEKSYADVRINPPFPNTSVAVNADKFDADENIDFDNEELSNE